MLLSKCYLLPNNTFEWFLIIISYLVLKFNDNCGLISDGDTVKSISIYGSPRRCGGQGDILSGSVAVFLSWARQHIEAADPDSNLSGAGNWDPSLALL